MEMGDGAALDAGRAPEGQRVLTSEQDQVARTKTLAQDLRVRDWEAAAVAAAVDRRTETEAERQLKGQRVFKEPAGRADRELLEEIPAGISSAAAPARQSIRMPEDSG
jgi:hypothetical protein